MLVTLMRYCHTSSISRRGAGRSAGRATRCLHQLPHVCSTYCSSRPRLPVHSQWILDFSYSIIGTKLPVLTSPTPFVSDELQGGRSGGRGGGGGRPNSGSHAGNMSAARRHYQPPRPQRYDKQKFLQANFRFLVSSEPCWDAHLVITPLSSTNVYPHKGTLSCYGTTAAQSPGQNTTNRDRVRLGQRLSHTCHDADSTLCSRSALQASTTTLTWTYSLVVTAAT